MHQPRNAPRLFQLFVQDSFQSPLKKALEPFATSEAYLNFMDDPGEGPVLVQTAYGNNYKRLVALKNHYDPVNFFHINQNIKPQAPVRDSTLREW